MNEEIYPYIDLEEREVAPPVVVKQAKVIAVTEVPGESVYVTFWLIPYVPITICVLDTATYFPDWSDDTVATVIREYVANLP